MVRGILCYLQKNNENNENSKVSLNVLQCSYTSKRVYEEQNQTGLVEGCISVLLHSFSIILQANTQSATGLSTDFFQRIFVVNGLNRNPWCKPDTGRGEEKPQKTTSESH